MLIRFSVDNYLSFRTKVTLDLEAGIIKEYGDDNILSAGPNNEIKLLKTLAIYGVNSSGKTNLMKAISFMKSFVLHSSKETQAAEKIPVETFRLNVLNDNKASTFDIEFLIEHKKFRYGFMVNKDLVLQEWLFQTEKKKEENLFIRSLNDFQISKKFRPDTKIKMDMVSSLTRSNALFISVLAQFNEELASKIVTWFKQCIIVFDANQDESISYTAALLSELKYNHLIHQILKQSDLGFTSVEQEIKEMAKKMLIPEAFVSALYFDSSKSYAVKTKHKKYNAENKPIETILFDLVKNESLGTQRYFGLLGPVVYALIERRVLWIDELDARLHTNLLHKIVRIFNSRVSNPNGAQLIFTSHDPLLLKKNLRRDQMIFVEKDMAEGSLVNSLYSKDPSVRNDASFDKDYLSGKYVSVPKIDTQLSLFRD